ncbi:MAG: hypothetical protein EBU68_03865, partial [Actinobacteria bacterium]|nr:hypothetical protein [Actinomycetota bacterium]
AVKIYIRRTIKLQKPVGGRIVMVMNDPDPMDGRPGTFSDAVRRLDYLQRLGVNVIALMPIHEFGGDRSWGYNPENVFAIESAYGGPEEFKKFVKAAHAKGMVVHLDVVHNHYNPSSDGLLEFDGPANVYFYSGDRASTDWGPRPNFDRPEVQRFIMDHTKMLLEHFRVDGFRWDSPENITGYRASGAYQILPAGKSLMTSINQMIRFEFPEAWSVAETANLLRIRSTPADKSDSHQISSNGLPLIGTKHFGILSVKGLSRVPKPAARRTALTPTTREVSRFS